MNSFMFLQIILLATLGCKDSKFVLRIEIGPQEIDETIETKTDKKDKKQD